jgi:catechol 2,3-dioxygenase-like lactoylglutathione lyase family enzyme
MLFKSLDFLYVPAPNIEASVKYYTEVLEGELLWKIHAYGVWVACISLKKSGNTTEKPKDISPYILLADHLNKNDVMLIYQVENLDNAIKYLKSKGWKEEEGDRIEIPPGPCCAFRDPAGNALVIYENARPFFMKEFKGRVDT